MLGRHECPLTRCAGGGVREVARSPVGGETARGDGQARPGNVQPSRPGHGVYSLRRLRALRSPQAATAAIAITARAALQRPAAQPSPIAHSHHSRPKPQALQLQHFGTAVQGATSATGLDPVLCRRRCTPLTTTGTCRFACSARFALPGKCLRARLPDSPSILLLRFNGWAPWLDAVS